VCKVKTRGGNRKQMHPTPISEYMQAQSSRNWERYGHKKHKEHKSLFAFFVPFWLI